MRKHTSLTMAAGASIALMLAGCQSSPTTASDNPSTTPSSYAAAFATVQQQYHSHAAWSSDHARPGFATFVKDGRLWVFEDGSQDLTDFLESGEPARHVSWIASGPGGITMRAVETDTMLAYIATKPGFRAFAKDGRVWVFQDGSKDLAEFIAKGEPAKHVSWIGAGPRGSTLRSTEAETMLTYLAAKPGFREFYHDGRLWVFEEGSAALADFLENGEPAKSVTWIAAGPRGTSLRAVDAEVLLAYMSSKPGFRTFVKDGRVWVFKEGSADLADFLENGEPAKSVTMIGQGPRGTSLRASDREIIVAYLAAAE